MWPDCESWLQPGSLLDTVYTGLQGQGVWRWWREQDAEQRGSGGASVYHMVGTTVWGLVVYTLACFFGWEVGHGSIVHWQH